MVAIAAFAYMAFELILLLGILIIAWWQKDMIWWLVAGLITVYIAADWMGTYPGISVVLWALAVFMFLKAVLMALQAGGTSKGWSQFKGLYDKIKGRREE